MNRYKWLAFITMTLDHIGFFFAAHFPDSLTFLLRTIGRLAFPLFVYLIVINYGRTRSVCRYALRLLSMALISEGCAQLASRLTGQNLPHNVFFTLTFGLIVVWCLDCLGLPARFRSLTLTPLLAEGQPSTPEARALKEALQRGRKGICLPVKTTPIRPREGMPPLLALLLIGLILPFSAWFQADYGLYGVLTFAVLGLLRLRYPAAFKNQPSREVLNAVNRWIFVWIAALALQAGLTQPHLTLSPALYSAIFIPLAVSLAPLAWSSTRPRHRWLSYLAYWYYPLHLFLLGLLARVLQ